MNSLSGGSDSWLSWFLRGILILLFFILFAKLFEVQIIKGDYYRTLSEDNRIRHVLIPASRGRILAKNGEALADNVEIKKRIDFSNPKGIILSEDLTDATEDEIVIDYKRVYPLADKFAHASGYLSVVSDKEVGTVNPDCPEKGIRVGGTLIGVTGLEEEYECLLMGTPGEELIEVNTKGEKIRVLGVKEPIAGKDLQTSIDYGLQQELASLMDKKGAAIVTDIDGSILAFYSSPSFDPNLLIDKTEKERIASLLKDSDLPFFNRVINGTFHPGSVFKPLVALAALEEGAIDKDFVYDDPGVITVNEFSYNNWYFTEYGRKEGMINLARAMARSTDTFFYKIGEMVGPVSIAKWADIFGLDKQTGIDLPGEAKGLIPTPEWKKKVIKESWFLGNTYHMSIGQGDVSVTPVELNTFIAAIANNGNICKPSFIASDSSDCQKINVSQKNLDLVKEGMKEACLTGGTAYTFFDFGEKNNGATVACKTGTAEVGVSGDPNAWFTFFSPIQDPKVVATVVFEKAGQGSQVAGPVARKIADYVYSR